MKGCKVIGLNHGHYAKETIQLIQKLQPEIKQILFISDSRLSSAFVKYGMEKIIKRDFKNLKYITFERKNHSTQQLLDTLQRLDKETGIVFYGWSSSKDKAENADYTKKIISAYSKTPVFTLSDNKTMEETSMCGGYYNSSADIAKATTDIMDQFDRGAKIAWGSISQINHARIYLNYPTLLEKHIDAELIPDNAVVYGKPESFVQKHIVSIIVIIGICLILFILLAAYAWSQRKLKILTNKTKIELEKLNHVLQVVLEASDAFPWAIDIINNELSAFGKKFKLEELKRVVYPDDFHFLGDTIRYLNADHARQEFIPHEVRFNINDTGYHWYKLRGVVDQRDEKGEPIYIIGSAENIEKQKQIESNLIETKEKAIESSNLKTAFLANMSHEIRTPLNAIVGYADLLATSEDLSEEDRIIFNKNIYANKEQLMQLFNDILDLSKIEAGTLAFNCKTVDFSEVIRDAVSSAKFNQYDTDSVRLIVDPMPETCQIFTDNQRIQQVIVNFITNAYKFTKSGSIHVGYKIIDKKNIYCYVKDTGIGIDKSQHKRIFERFEKLDSFKTGTGLGLSISKMIIEKLRGEIGVESAVGEGATFWFKLPTQKV
jgi:signal transduction histidine kinase